MKKLKLFTVLLTVALIAGVGIFYACKKEEQTNGAIGSGPQKAQMSKELERLYAQVPIVDFGNITLVNGDILKFESREHYQQVYNDLYMQCLAWCEIFYNEYDVEDEKELDEIIMKLGFDENTPLLKFEEKYKTLNNNLRAQNSTKEKNWLASGAMGASPSDKIILCDVKQTLFSKFHEVIIGDTICQKRLQRYEILIPTSEIRYIDIYRSTPLETFIQKGPIPGIGWPQYAVKGGDDDDEGCYRREFNNSNNKEYTFENVTYKFEWEYDVHHSWLSGYHATATLSNFKNEGTKWEKDRAVCGLWLNTRVYLGRPEGCEGRGWVGNGTTVITKKKKRSKTAPLDIAALHNDEKKFLRDNTGESHVIVRHYGTEYTYNVETGLQQ